MIVKLIAYTQWKDRIVASESDPAGIVELAASVCYDSHPTKGFAIAQSCAESGHMSVWEHISFVFYVGGVSRALLAQLTRHRHAGFSVRSQRYCLEDDFEYVNPFDEKVMIPDTGLTFKEAFDYDMESIRQAYSGYVKYGMPPEDARMVLPNACCTTLYVSANARALIEMSHLRLCSRAQKEIRQLFAAMKTAVYEVSPTVAEMMVPTCEIHKSYPFCTERNCCGKHPKLSDVYNATGVPAEKITFYMKKKE